MVVTTARFVAALALLIARAAVANVDGTLDASLHPPLGTQPFYGIPGLVDFAVDYGGAAPSTNNDRAAAVLPRPDGTIIVAGTSWAPGPTRSNHLGVIARFLPDGTLDTAFGIGGRATIGDPDSYDLTVNSIAAQSDRVLVAVSYRLVSDPSTEYAMLVRLDAEGNVLDIPIGGNADERANHGFNKVITDADGNIYVAGYWNASGGTRLEVTFAGPNAGAGNEASFNFPLGSGADGARALDLILRHMPGQSCGQGCFIPAHDEVMTAGSVYRGIYPDGLANHDCVVAAFRRNLDDLFFGIDPGFNGGNPLLIDFPAGGTNEGDNYCRAVAPRDGSGVVVGGENYFLSTLGGGSPGLASNYALAEVDESGAVTRQDAFAFFQSLATQGVYNGIVGMRREAGGKLLVTGLAGTGDAGRAPSDAGVIRFNADYSRDATFGNDGAGLAILSLDNQAGLAGAQREQARAIALDTHGRIVVVGDRSYNLAGGNDYDWLVARLVASDVIFRDGFDNDVP